MTPAELLACATEFDAGPIILSSGRFFDPDVYGDSPDDQRRVYIVRRYNARTKEVKWAIHDTPFDLNKSGNWEYAPRGSSVNDAYLKRCRYNSAEEAFDHYHRWKQAVCEWARKKLAKAKPGEQVTLKLPKRGIRIEKEPRLTAREEKELARLQKEVAKMRAEQGTEWEEYTGNGK